MKILRLQSSNIKRITAVDIELGDGLVTIGGKNGAGKSSVLDSVAYALGGQALIPAEPIRSGETEGFARLDLGELVVTRRFRRDRLTCMCDKGMGADPPVHDAQCPWWKFGPTTSTLVVTNKDGAKYPTPQAILDRLLGSLSFDPLAFARATAKSQNETLRALAGIDFTDLDEQRRTHVALRSDLKKQLTSQEALLASAKQFPEAPAEEITSDATAKMLQDAEVLRKAANTAESGMLLAAQDRDNAKTHLDNLDSGIAELEMKLDAARKIRPSFVEAHEKAFHTTNELRKNAEAAKTLVPDVASIQQKLKDIEDTNRKVRANVARTSIQKRRDELVDLVETKTSEVNSVDLAKAAALANAKFPIDGLGLTDDGVTFGGRPFEQASTSEQLRTSVAIGLALNPALKVLLVRDGNALDDDSRKLVAEQVAAAGAQVLMEFVTSDAGEVAVMIEDGHVA